MAFPKLTRPLVFFDLETTGLLVELDRIIEIGLLKIHPDGRRERLTQRFDPGIRIPAESTAVHGITNKDLEGQPRFAEAAKRLFDFFGDADLGGFALRRLDIPMLVAEFARAGLTFSMDGRRVVDASAIYREKERRNLTAAYKFYVGKDLVGAHGAEADNDAAFEVFLAQLDRYPDLPRDIPGLHDFCKGAEPAWVDSEGKLLWRDGTAHFGFGKYRGKPLPDVARQDPGYLDWVIHKGDFPKDFVEICVKAKGGVFPAPPKSNGRGG